MQKVLLQSFVLIMILVSCKSTENVKSNSSKEQTVYTIPSYRAAYTKYVDLINTTLFLTPMWKEKKMQGSAEITFRQHFYPSDSVVFDAKMMDIKGVYLGRVKNFKKINYDYDQSKLTVRLPKTYTSEEEITLTIDYIAQPEKMASGGSDAIKSDKGLFFVDVDSTDDSRPTQLWTQGETESNSVWFPTIESPEQKMTTEIFITVDSAFTTLSNGLLLEKINNNNGTFSWHWKQDLPTAPYLTMIAVGEFAIVKDKWNGLEVSYYVDPAYEKNARMVFGKTPEMIGYFSNLLSINYPWQKYSQIVLYDYVSGAMENTTAVVHGTNMHQDEGDYLDENYEHYISHELFHHWFGDLVTCRSWSNITLNEGFANYAEYLWMEYKYGKTVAESHLLEDLRIYLRAIEKSDPPLIRYQYEDREDVYDQISYNKGGCVLHMLRNYLGDEAFFKGLNLYLTTNKFGSAEADDLRQALEKISGEDLNWFFNQWLFRGGHPQVTVDFKWDNSQNKETLTLKQVQDLTKNPLYKLPLDVDFYFDGKTERKKITMTKNVQKFEFTLSEKPKAVVVDPDGILVGTIDQNRSDEETIYVYDHSPNVRTRSKALSTIGFVAETNLPSSKMVRRALKDPSQTIRQDALTYASIIFQNDPEGIKDLIFDVAKNDSSSDIRSTALARIHTYYKADECVPLFENALHDKSHLVVATAFDQLASKDPVRGEAAALKLQNDSSSTVLSQLTYYYSDNDTIDHISVFKRAMRYAQRFDKFSVVDDLAKYAGNHYNLNVINSSIDIITKDALASSFDYYKSTCAKILLELEGSLKKSVANVNKNESKWLHYNPGKNKTEIISELNSFIESIDNKRTLIQGTN